MHARRLSLLALLALVGTVGLSCGRELTGPEGPSGRVGRIAGISPRLPAIMADAGFASLVEYSRLRVRITRADQSLAIEKVVPFGPQLEEIEIELTVPLLSTAPESGEPMDLLVQFLDDAGNIVFSGGPVAIVVKETIVGDPPTQLDVEMAYVGPGALADHVIISPSLVNAKAGDALAFTAQRLGPGEVSYPLAPVEFTSTDPTLVVIDIATGTGTAQNKRGTAMVIATLINDAADTATVNVVPTATSIAASSGGGQTGEAGTPLALPVTVRVLAADGLGVGGVNVNFAASNGGSPGSSVVSTDSDGFASTSWTLGPVFGAQSMTASVTALTGSPVTFTATSVSGAPTHLAFTTQPSNVVAGQGIAPPVAVTARTAGGLTATGFTGNVTIAIGSNPGGASLGGVLTVAAVDGVATFPGLTLDRIGTGYTLVATSGALTQGNSSGFDVSPAAAAALAFTFQPVGGTPGATIVPAPRVEARDAFGNRTAYTGTVSIAFGANPGGATLGGTTTVNAVAGEATFSDLTVSAPGAGYTFVATGGGMSPATSDPFTVGSTVISWINNTGGAWSNTANWDLGRLPNASDVVNITLGGTYTVSLDVNTTVSAIVVGGASGTQTLSMSSRTLTLGAALNVAPLGALYAANSSITGVGAIVNDGSITLAASTIDLVVDNRGTLVASGSSILNGALATNPGSVLRVAQVDGSTGTAHLTVANGFTNLAAIELSVVIAQPYNAQLTVTSGTLTNAAGGTIRSLAGTTGGGSRTLQAQLDNQGLLDVQVPLVINASSAAHLNSGTIDVTTADLTINQGGASPSLTSTGTITIGSGRTLAVVGGSISLAAGTLGGAGTLSLNSVTLNLGIPLTTAVTGFAVLNSVVNGPAALTNASGRTLTLVASTVSAPFVNEGTLITSGNSLINGPFTTSAGSVLRVAQVDGSTGTASLTVANGFTNLGAIELSVVIAQPYNAQLVVQSGTLVNAPGSTISSLAGTVGGGSRTLTAQLDNQGLLDVQVPLVINASSADHQNSGTIDLTVADLTLNQGGASPSFTNTGTITLGSARTFAVTGGTLALTSGTFGGPGALSLSSVTLALGAAFSNAVTQLVVLNTTINGPGALTNAAGQTLTLVASTVNASLDNQGTLIASGNSVINGTLTTNPGSLLRIGQVDGSTGTASLTVANGFTNVATIDLTVAIAQPYNAQLIVSSGTLVNAPTGTIRSIAGVQAGGTRTLTAALDNQGLLDVQVPLLLNASSATHLNSGTIDVTAANLTLSQGGTSPSFTNTGTITLGSARTFAVTGGTLALTSGTFGGPGSLSLNSVTLALGAAFSNAVTQLAVLNTTINGPGALTNAAGQTLTLVASTVNASLDNQGTLITSGNSVINGSFTTTAASILRVAQVDGSTGTASLTVANGFTNLGAIELSVVIAQPYNAQLVVQSGTLVNAPGSTISSLAGTVGGGSRTLTAQLDNQGLLDVQVPLVINASSADHQNSGTIDLTVADLTLNQGGASPSFTNTGTITLGSARTFAVTGGTLALTSGTFGGPGSLSLNSVTLALGAAFSNAVTQLVVLNTTINGPGALTNAAGQTLTLVASTVNASLDNQGTLVASGNSVINGSFTTTAASILRVGQVDGSTGTANLTITNGFTNLGVLELTVIIAQPYNAQLSVPNGTLVNAASGIIRALPGTLGGGSRTLDAELDNQGLLEVQAPLSLGRASADHVNAGSIDVSLANLAINQSGATPSFSNTGVITISGPRAVTVNGGSFTGAPGATITGGTLTLASVSAAFNGAAPAVSALNLTSTTASFSTALNSGTVAYAFANSTVNGAGPFTNAAGQVLTLVSTTMNMPVDNLGTIVVSGSSALNGTFTTNPGSVLRIGQVDGSSSQALLTVANGFTNVGGIELTVVIGIAYSAQLTVTNGTLLNASTGTISALPGAAAGGSRTLDVQLDNQGQLLVLTPLTLTHPSADHVSSGTIDVSAANLTISQSGTSPSFTNSGAITIGAGRTLAVGAGSFTSDATGTITGGTLSLSGLSAAFSGATPAVSAMVINGSSASFAAPINSGTVAYTITNSTIGGAGPFTNPVGQTLTLIATTLNLPVDNQGTIVASGATAINGALTTGAGSLLRVGQVDGSSSLAHLTVANGFTNLGAIELTVVVGIAYSSQITVTSGTLLNAPGGTIAALPGAAAGGARTIAAQLDNQGLVTATAPLTIAVAGADHLNSGTIDVSGGDLTIAQSGVTPSFTNSGTITIGVTRTLSVSAGSFTSGTGANLTGGGLTFTGASVAFDGATPAVSALSLSSSTATFAGTITTAATALTLINSTISGSAAFTNALGQSVTLYASTIGMPVLNEGTLVASGASFINGALTTAPTSILRVGMVDGSSSLASLTVANGFTNQGAIELTVLVGIAYSSQLAVTSGTLVNAPGGTFTTLDGAAAGGSRTFVGALENQGTLSVAPGSAGLLGITGSLASSGTINLELGGTALTQFDRIVVSPTPGTLTLGGTLNVGLINAFTPASGNSFAVLGSASRSGTFGTTNLPPGITTPPTYTGTGVTLAAP